MKQVISFWLFIFNIRIPTNIFNNVAIEIQIQKKCCLRWLLYICSSTKVELVVDRTVRKKPSAKEKEQENKNNVQITKGNFFIYVLLLKKNTCINKRLFFIKIIDNVFSINKIYYQYFFSISCYSIYLTLFSIICYDNYNCYR